jgi:signal transduction histidine kinase
MHGHEVTPASHLSDIGPLALAALVRVVANLGLVGAAISIDTGAGFRAVLGRMVPPPFGGFALSYALLSALGVASAVAYERLPYGPLAVTAVFVPLLFARLSIAGARAQQELSERLRKQQEALLHAAERIFEEREAERNRIAEDIHDSSLQSLAAATYACTNVLAYLDEGRIAEARALAETAQGALDQAMSDLRGSLVDLRRSVVTEAGLNETIRHYCDQAGVLWGAVIDVQGEIDNEPPAPVALAAFQILQEGLVNALKHSNSGIVRVKLRDDQDGMVRIEIEDEGPGFDPEESAGEEHHGMRLMHERAERVGGRIELDTAPGRGTRLTAILPGGVSR